MRVKSNKMIHCESKPTDVSEYESTEININQQQQQQQQQQQHTHIYIL